MNGRAASDPTRLRIGVIAPEFPPDVGGMHTLAWGLSNALGATDEVVVYTRDDQAADDHGAFERRPLLSGNLKTDVRRLGGENVDAWLALNGGLVPLAPQLSAPFCVYLHGNDFLNPWLGYGSWWLEPLQKPYMVKIRRAIRRTAIRRYIGSVAHVFTNSAQTADLARQMLALGSDRISVCPPGVDDMFFQDHAAPMATPLHVMTVTRLTKYSTRKNVDGVLRAVAKLEPKIDIRYTVVGDGDDRARLEALAAELGIGNRVEFAGRLSAEELLDCYRRADLFILASKASRYDVEGFGIVYLEAAASGVPAICSREGGAVDAVADGRNGIIIPSSSVEAIADGIERFVKAREQFAPERVRTFAEQYRWPKAAAPLRELTAELASARRGAALPNGNRR